MGNDASAYALRRRIKAGLERPLNLMRFWRYRNGHESPLIFIVGLPRSGTTWLTQMFTSVEGYRYVYPWHATQTDHNLRENTLRAFAYQLVVMRLHLPWSEENARILKASQQRYVVIYRDLRDVVVSWYHYVSKNNPQHFLHSELRSLSLEEGIDYYIEHILDYEMRWIRDWRNNRHPELSTETRYETLRGDTLSDFGRLAGFFGLDLTDAEIARIVDENSFTKRTKREPGTEDVGAHLRKGVVGDWRNVLLPRHVDAFKRSAGELLIELGYEKDGRWGL